MNADAIIRVVQQTISVFLRGGQGDPGAKGDPGGNIMAIGLFTAASALIVPGGTDMVRSAGYHTLGKGVGDYVSDAAVDASYVAAHPRISFRSANGRGFKLVMRDRVHVDQFGAFGEQGATVTPRDDTPALLAMAADHPVECELVFGPNGLRQTAPVTWSKFAYFNGNGARVIGVFGANLTDYLWTIAISDSSNTDSRLFLFEKFKYLKFESGGGGALDLVGGSMGNAANIQFSFRNSAFANLDTSSKRAIRLRGIGTHHGLFDTCQVENGVDWECADNVRWQNTYFTGIKTALYVDLIYGSFGNLVQSCACTARDGFMWVNKGSHINVISAHIEQASAYGENQNTFKASVVVYTDGTDQNICRALKFTGTSFGGGSNQDWPWYLVFGCHGFEVEGGMSNLGDAGQDGAIGHPSVVGTRLHPNIHLRGARGGASVDGLGNVTANALDPSELYSINDNGTGTYGIWKYPVLTNGWTSPGLGFRLKKAMNDDVQFDSEITVGATLTAATPFMTLNDGFRPRVERTVAVWDRVNRSWTDFRIKTSGEIEPKVAVIAGAIFDWSPIRIGVRGRIKYNPGS
jgi:hypothetical protein